MTDVQLSFVGYEGFGEPARLPRDVDGCESMIARVSSSRIGRELYEWKRLRDFGWDVSAVLAPDGSAVMLACRRGRAASSA